MDHSFHERIDAALFRELPLESLLALAREFKAEGMSQQTMTELFDAHRAKHQSDRDDTAYNAILDTMDFIVGYCRKGAGLFDSE